MKKIDLGTIKIDATEYASQGNAILGIRDSGKSYTATYIAERLLDAGIPFVAFDPIGIWKYLRVPGVGKAYPIVVAGGSNGDLPLTVHSAPEIVRAAMRENIPLVLDFYSIKMSKSEWKQIVEQCVRLLLYENGDHGLRHIFIEEAAEFAPQRVGPDQGRVYAEIEKLARMGGNAQLGYTLINQRAEEVNKAVLELCDCLFLHRQKGKNSLTSLGKWLDIGDVSASKEIIKSLPKMPQGECWVWLSGSDAPTHIKVPQKNTQHPDRRAMHQSGSGKEFKAVDVSSFVTQMSTTLEKHLAEAQANDPAQLRRRIAELEKQLAQRPTIAAPQIVEREKPVITDAQLSDLNNAIEDITASNLNLTSGLKTALSSVNDSNEKTLGVLKEIQSSIRAVTAQRPAQQFHATTSRASTPPSFNQTTELLKGKVSILRALARCHPMHLTISQVSQLSSQSLKSSTFKQYIRDLKREFFIQEDHDGYKLTDAGMVAINFSPSYPQTPQEKIEMWRSALLAGELSIFDHVVSQHPDWVYIADISTATEQSLKSSTFKQYIRNLCRNKLFEKHGEKVRLNQGTFNS